MKKFIVIIMFCSIFFVACTQNKIYIEPEVTGKIYSSHNKLPIKNTVGYIAFYLNDDKENYIKTNNDGEFYLKPSVEKYILIKPNLKDLYQGTGQIYVKFDGYKLRIFDYSKNHQEQNPNPNPGGKNLEKVNVGIIYLDPE